MEKRERERGKRMSDDAAAEKHGVRISPFVSPSFAADRMRSACASASAMALAMNKQTPNELTKVSHVEEENKLVGICNRQAPPSSLLRSRGPQMKYFLFLDFNPDLARP